MENITNEMFKLGYHLSYIRDGVYYFKSNKYLSYDYIIIMLNIKEKIYWKNRYYVTATFAQTFDIVDFTTQEAETIKKLFEEEN